METKKNTSELDEIITSRTRFLLLHRQREMDKDIIYFMHVYAHTLTVKKTEREKECVRRDCGGVQK